MDIDWHEVFEYRDGVLIFKERPSDHFSTERARSIFNSKYAGKPAGAICKASGYRLVGLRYKGHALRLYAHRIIWEMFNPPIPKGMSIDHIDHCSANNRIENLRLATKSTNGMNRKVPANSSSGLKNIAWAKDKGKWRVYASLHKKQYNGGLYSDLELAELVAHELREKIHGEFACHD